MITVFAIKKGKKYLKGFEANEKYKKGIRSIQSGAHLPGEFKVVWGGEEPNWMDCLTAGEYLRDLAYNISNGDEKIKKLVIEVGQE